MKKSTVPDLLSGISFSGEIHTEDLYLRDYSTDASPYREKPVAVAYPKTAEDIRQLILRGSERKVSLIPRGGGTSLAGQVVGNGVVVDVSRYMNRILEINVKDRWVRVEPGVVLDQLNQSLRSQGLFFAPETSTSNRCTLGGMAGNNSCGSHSLVYGSTRDHVLSLKALLSDGSEACFEELDQAGMEAKLQGNALENKLYRKISDILSPEKNRELIRKEYPDPEIRRRNNGYALDELMKSTAFGGSERFNMCKLLVGSEGTLVFITELKLRLTPLPPSEKSLVCVHLSSVEEALYANLIALKYKPAAIELMDKVILDCTKNNLEQQRNRFFIQGDPGAILIVEFAEASSTETSDKIKAMEAEMRSSGYGWHFPVVSGPNVSKVWELRKSGLGVLTNMPGDAKPVSVTEDTAVNPRNLPEYIRDFQEILLKHKLECVYHAHIATGELHLRPVLNLKKSGDVALYRELARETALLVKKYRGSLSGEHGDGRLRGEFIPLMYGKVIYGFFKEIKQTFDPQGVFNAGKIIETPPMNTSLRYVPDRQEPIIQTFLDFSKQGGLLRAVENCNGAGDCRKSSAMGGVLCPSYKATGEEKNSTRARANILREYLTHPVQKDLFDHNEIYEVMDTCLSCKGCKSECPSNVDMAKMKAEFLHQWYRKHGVPLRTRLIAYIDTLNQLGSVFPALYNKISNSAFAKRCIGFSKKRTIPGISRHTLRHWARYYLSAINPSEKEAKGKLWFFADEFTNRQEPEIGRIAIQLLCRLGYRVSIPRHGESGRAALSKGLLKRARYVANRNVKYLSDLISEETPLVGLEPSCILSFRDEYPDLVSSQWKEHARRMAPFALTFEEFIAREADKGHITPECFTEQKAEILFHGHCQQKAIVSTKPLQQILSLPSGFRVREIPSGCCGMAGSFGYEKEHYELSMKVGELILFPEIRKAGPSTILVAPGTSCRHHIADATHRQALHPAVVLYQALQNKTFPDPS